jgi:hypothetical protein
VINNHYTTPDGVRTSVAVEEPKETSTGIKVYEGNAKRAEAAPPKPEPPVASGAYVRDDKPNIYLIALKDSTVRQAIGFWVKGDALHFVTPAAQIHEVPLVSVDRDASVRLNSERKLEFDLGIQ